MQKGHKLGTWIFKIVLMQGMLRDGGVILTVLECLSVD